MFVAAGRDGAGWDDKLNWDTRAAQDRREFWAYRSFIVCHHRGMIIVLSRRLELSCRDELLFSAGSDVLLGIIAVIVAVATPVTV